MALIAKTRIDDKPGVMMVTGGPGASNTLIGVADAYLDSIPLIILAGQENSEYMDDNKMRGKGVQGLDMSDVMSSVTKWATCLDNASNIKYVLEQAFHRAYEGRPGPVWIDIPQNLQWAEVNPDELKGFTAMDMMRHGDTMKNAAAKTLELLKTASRPLLWVGHGIRLSKCEEQFRRVLEKLNVPALVSWQAADLVPDDHPLFLGRAGTYGQRWANLALQNCDLLITLGTRLALPQRGYNDALFAPRAKKVIVEIDPIELKKFKFKIDVPVLGNVASFIDELEKQIDNYTLYNISWWKARCEDMRDRYPMAIAPTEYDTEYINSYWFIDQLSKHLTKDHIIITDMGTSLTCTHAAIKLKEGQRLVTSTGLGEMGYGLPAAIGASLGNPTRPVVLIVGEGGLMMNLQELQTLKNLNLPIKIFLINNNGYLTIKHTHNALYKSDGNASATSPETGVTFPDFSKVISAFDIEFRSMGSKKYLDGWIQAILNSPGCVVGEVPMSEFQELIPKLAIKVKPDGTVFSPPLEDMYPFLSEEQLRKEMIGD